MRVELTAKRDKKGSEGALYAHYTFGKPGDLIAGGLYMNKNIIPPETITITIKEE